MDARFINPVLNALVNILVTMAQMSPPKTGKPSLKKDKYALGVVTGVIDMAGKQATGSIAVSFSKPVALDLTKRMLRLEQNEIDDQTKDLVGEIANMVAGGAKAALEGDGFDFDMSLPRVFSGEQHQVIHNVTGPVIILPFTTNTGDFFVEVCFDQSRKK